MVGRSRRRAGPRPTGPRRGSSSWRWSPARTSASAACCCAPLAAPPAPSARHDSMASELLARGLIPQSRTGLRFEQLRQVIDTGTGTGSRRGLGRQQGLLVAAVCQTIFFALNHAHSGRVHWLSLRSGIMWRPLRIMHREVCTASHCNSRTHALHCVRGSDRTSSK